MIYLITMIFDIVTDCSYTTGWEITDN